MKELKRFKDYYNQSFWAWFFPKNLSYALMHAGGYFNKSESQLQCAHLVCNHFELAYGKMGSFWKWFFKRQFDDFKNSELYQKYLLIPIQERCIRKETDFNMYNLSTHAPLFPLLQSISGTDAATALDNAKKVLGLVAPLQEYGYSKHLAVYGIAQHTENEDFLYQEFPLISLNQDYSGININLDTSIITSAEYFNTALAQLIRLVSSSHCPRMINITFPSTIKNHDLTSLQQAIAVKNKNEKYSIHYFIAAEKTMHVAPEKTWSEPFAWIRTIYPIYLDQQKKTISDQSIDLVQEPKDQQFSF